MKRRTFDPAAQGDRIRTLEQQLEAARSENVVLKAALETAWGVAAWGGLRAPLAGERAKRSDSA